MAREIIKKPTGLGIVNKNPNALGKLKSLALKSSDYNEALFLVLDHSASMGCMSIGVSRIDAVKQSVEVLVNSSGTSRIAVVTFDDRSEIVCPITNQHRMVKDAVDRVFPRGGTEILPALRMSADILYLQPARVRRMIVLSDGEAWDCDGAIAWATAEKAAFRLPIIDTVYFNDSPEGKALMMRLAEISGGKFYYAADLSQLMSTFKQLDVKTRGLLTSGK